MPAFTMRYYAAAIYAMLFILRFIAPRYACHDILRLYAILMPRAPICYAIIAASERIYDTCCYAVMRASVERHISPPHCALPVYAIRHWFLRYAAMLATGIPLHDAAGTLLRCRHATRQRGFDVFNTHIFHERCRTLRQTATLRLPCIYVFTPGLCYFDAYAIISMLFLTTLRR